MLPNFIIIGAMKSGTSSLYHYLRAHPDISMSNPKELDFFDTHIDKGVRWYEKHFPENTHARGEASTNYSKYPLISGIPEKMHDLLPDAKLIYLLRDPIDRIVSHFVQSYSERYEHGRMEEALLDTENNHFVACSKYYMQLEQYLEFYPADRILVLTSDELRDKRRETLQTIFRFLGVDDAFFHPDFDIIHHLSSRKRRKGRLAHFIKESGLYGKIKPRLSRPVIRFFQNLLGTPFERPVPDDNLRKKLADGLADDVAALRRFTGRPFSAWSL